MLLFFISMVFPLLSLFYHFDFGLLFSGLSLALTPICTKDSPGGAKIFSPFFCGFFAKINLSFFWFFSLFPLIFINLLLTPYRKLSGQRRVLWPSVLMLETDNLNNKPSSNIENLWNIAYNTNCYITDRDLRMLRDKFMFIEQCHAHSAYVPCSFCAVALSSVRNMCGFSDVMESIGNE